MVLPNDTNHNTLFGGRLLEWMDEMPVFPTQTLWKVVVTASINNVSFNEPIFAGEIISLNAKLEAFNS